MCVCLCVNVSERRRLKQLSDLILILYLGSSCKYPEQFSQFSPNPKLKASSYKNFNFDFVKNSSNDFEHILVIS